MSNGDLNTARVVILMGSDSDLPRMQQCLSSLTALDVPFDIRVASAHRTPARVLDIVQRAEAASVQVFICAAGGAAHLAGAVAAHTTLPVIGVPLAVPPLDVGLGGAFLHQVDDRQAVDVALAVDDPRRKRAAGGRRSRVRGVNRRRRNA